MQNPNLPTTSPRGGRPIGAVNKVKREAAELARRMLQSDAYQDWLWDRITTRTLQPETERLLWNYGYGLPPAHLTVSAGVDEDLSSLSYAELATLVEQLHGQIIDVEMREAQEDVRLAERERDTANAALHGAFPSGIDPNNPEPVGRLADDESHTTRREPNS